MEKLLEMLRKNRGRIVSTASLSIALIDYAKSQDMLFVDESGLGYVYLPEEVSLPTGFLAYVADEKMPEESKYSVVDDSVNGGCEQNEPEQTPSQGPVRRAPGYSAEDLPNLFTYHPPKGDQAERYAKISKAAEAFALVVLENTPPCADQTVAIRKIIDCRMSANMCIAINE